MTIEAQFDRIATALEGIATRIDALGAAISALNSTQSHPTFVQGTDVTAEPLAEVQPLKDALATSTPAEIVQAAVTAEPKKRGRPALKAVETAPAPEPAPEAPPVVATPAPEAAPAVTADDVKDAVLAYAGQHGKAAALEILERHGAARVRDLDPSTYGAVLADIKKG